MDHLTPRQAAEFLAKDHTAVFVDCRSEMEFLFVGHPVGAMMIPWNDGPDWEINPNTSTPCTGSCSAKLW